MTSGYMFPSISPGEKGEEPVRGSSPVKLPQMLATLKRYAVKAGEAQEFTLYSFRAGGAISWALAGDSLPSIMQKAYWKNPKTAWGYMRLMEVVAPGSEGESMMEEVTEEQYRELNEFPLSKQSRSLAAFGDQDLI